MPSVTLLSTAVGRHGLFDVPPLLAQAAQEMVFHPPEDVVLVWAQRAGLVVMVSSVLLILFVLLRRRQRLMENQSKWLLFLGLCVLPIPVMFLSAGVGMEESKSVDFCHSCHAPMDPFVDDMKDPQSETLAAMHYKNRLIQSEHCWACHSDYGIAGTTEAKLSGLYDITKAVLDTWEAPISLRHPYNWAICLDCHGDSASFKAETNHQGVVQAAIQGEIACTDCHEMAHTDPDERSSK